MLKGLRDITLLSVHCVISPVLTLVSSSGYGSSTSSMAAGTKYEHEAELKARSLLRREG